MFGADVVINATNPVLGQAPKAFQSVHVRFAFDVDIRGVIDALVLIAKLRERPVHTRLIAENHAAGHNAFSHVRQECVSLNIWQNARHDAALALYSAPYWRLPYWSFWIAIQSLFEMLVLFFSAVKTFVNFNFAREFRSISVFVQQRTNPIEHSPRGFVRDANLTLDLLGADTASRRGHQEDGVKPEFQRRGRILEDRAAHRVFMVSAELARIRRPVCDAMMLGDLLTLRTEDAVWIESALEPFEARCIVWEFAVKLHH